MKFITLRLTLQAATLAIASSTAGSADSADTTHTRQGLQARIEYRGLQAKIEYCTDCHGSSGQGYHGYLTMPRLAGQTTEYFENQLRAFAQRSRDRDMFLNMSKVHSLSPEMRTALAAHFRGLNPGPVGGGPNNLVAVGKSIYEDGVAEANIPACAACHGPEAKGQDAIPRLADQLYPYIIKELTNWSKKRGQGSVNDDTSAIMTPIAHSLTLAQISAIAAYLSHLSLELRQ